MFPIPIFNTQQLDEQKTATFLPLLNPDQCAQLIKDYVTDSPKVARIDGDVIDRRRSTLIHPVPRDEKSQWLFELLADRIGRFNQFGYGFDVVGIPGDLQLLEYNEGDYYDWHIDIGSGSASLRKLSVIIQLSAPEDYEGGEVIFKASEKEHELPKKQGQIAVFPSYVLHKVNPVTKGKRYALVAWVVGSKSFR